MLNKNDIFTAKIEGYNSEGLGIARINGIVVFVPYAIVAEECQIKIVKVMRNFAYGRLVKLPNKCSVNRINPDCPIYKQCGGCSLRHMTYSEELKFKKQKVQDAISKIGKIPFEVSTIYQSKPCDRYRNHAQLPVAKDKQGNIKIGMFAARSHEVINISDCMLQNKNVKAIVKCVKA